ncbi:PLP-dependent aminotransferase family protein [Actinomadura sp. HBU206391]|uniref:aminotransferase-like domain-containing protein n=1 Tax=Actinomadura sp. HBU206391 TaxID=2731692 RepID=UPI001650C815|nr:PLP-dependent aminotransferase family protein [Actinomadura sp. HBU206391]MBC6462372.1 PLP-dependent aminotransferase family protein [Actinomadura sp. HBU206391]
MHEDSSIAILTGTLRGQISGLRPGERLPSSRELMERHRVSPVTVSRALGVLAAEGLVVTRPGSGTYVADRRPAVAGRAPDFDWQSVALGDRTVDAGGVRGLLTPPPEGAVALSGGYLHPSLQPLRALATAATRAARRPDAWGRPPLSGVPELRAWFARDLGGDVSPSDVLISGGGQDALTTVLRALLPPGAPLLVESPTYLGALAAARAAGLHPVPVPMDGDGVRPGLLAEAFAMTGSRVFYCQPTFHNPTGAVLPAERREQVLAVVRAAGAFVIEDDYARHLAIDPAPGPLVARDQDGRVVHIASLTKGTAPSMRIAAVVARGPVAERIRATQMVDAFFPARSLQETALELLTSPGWPRHLRLVSAALRRRRDALLAALARDLPETPVTRPTGGAHLWARLPAGVDDVALTEAALRAGVLVSAGRPFYPAEPPGPRLRLTYSAAATEAELSEGVRRLAQVLSKIV